MCTVVFLPRVDLGKATSGAAANHSDVAQRVASYHAVAEHIVKEAGEVFKLIKSLKLLQDDFATSGSIPAPFVAVVASSGTGKTQLAIIPERAFEDDAKAHVVYLYMGGGDAEAVQDLYRPHTALGRVLSDLIKEQEGWSFHDDPKPVNAGTLIADDNTKLSKVFGLLWQLLQTAANGAGVMAAGKPSPLPFSDLHECTKQLLIDGQRFLVFVDKAPPESDRPGFFVVISLRDILRALGITPILMSTHAGAHTAVPTRSADSRAGESSTWVHFITKLPGTVAQGNCFDALSGKENIAAFFREAAALDRPLVTNMLQVFVAGHDEQENEDDVSVLQQLLHAIAKHLWAVKREAWNLPSRCSSSRWS
jgi:hypothetical protein